MNAFALTRHGDGKRVFMRNSMLCALLLAVSFEAMALPVATTNKASYVAGENITVNYNVLWRDTDDYLALGLLSFAPGDFFDFQYANNPPNRQAVFSTTGLAAGTYVIRTYHYNDIEIVAESAPFIISEPSATVTTTATSYNNGDTVVVNYTALSPGQGDWVGIVPAGQPGTAYVQWLPASASNTASFTGLAVGAYEAVAFENNTFVELARSTTFTVDGTATVGTDLAVYASGAPVVVTYAGLSAATQDWIGIVPANLPNSAYVAFAYADNTNTVTFSNIADGTYRARAFTNNTTLQVGQSAEFVVGAAVPTATITPSQTTISSTQPVAFSFTNAPGLPTDWVALAMPGSAPTSYVAFQYTAGGASGAGSFVNPGVGQYVLRLYTNNTYSVVGQSVTITVVP
jgi:hypothetical protein